MKTDDTFPTAVDLDILPIKTTFNLDSQVFDDFEKSLEDTSDNERLTALLARPKRWGK